MSSVPQDAHKRIMIVDDDRIIRRHIVDLIQKLIPDLQAVYEAMDGKHALDQLPQTLPGILFVDVRMPRMSGLEFIQSAQKRYPWMQFFILSNFDEFEMVKGAFKEGVLDYVLKYELEPDDLVRLVEQGRTALETARTLYINQQLLRCNEMLADMRSTADRLLCGRGAFAPGSSCGACFYVLPPTPFDTSWTAQVMLGIAKKMLPNPQDEITMFYRQSGYGDTCLQIGFFVGDAGIRWCDAKHLIQRRAQTLSQHLTLQGLQHYGVYSEHYAQDGLRAEIRRLQSAAEWIFYEDQNRVIPLPATLPDVPLKDSPVYSVYPLQCALLLRHGCCAEAVGKLQSTVEHLRRDRPSPQAAKQVCYRYLVALQQQGISIPRENIVPDHLARILDSMRQAFQAYNQTPAITCGNANIDRAIAYITANISTPLSLGTVARESGYSKNHFSRIFKETVGITFNAFVNTTRINIVGELLLLGIPTDKAAFQVGFSDVRYFRLVFEKIKGMTVAQWREQKGDQA